MIRRLPRSTRTDTLFPYTCSSDLVTTSPDVTVSTNLGAFVNQRGLFRRGELKDVFASAKIPSAQKWSGNRVGQHIELGIADDQNLAEVPRHVDFNGVRPLERRDRFDFDQVVAKSRSEEHTSELQSLMRISYAVFCLKQKTQ